MHLLIRIDDGFDILNEETSSNSLSIMMMGTYIAMIIKIKLMVMLSV